MIEPCFEFLFDLSYPNLFEGTREGYLARCKVCRETVRMYDRESHFRKHRRELERARKRRAEAGRAEARRKMREYHRARRKEKV